MKKKEEAISATPERSELIVSTSKSYNEICGIIKKLEEISLQLEESEEKNGTITIAVCEKRITFSATHPCFKSIFFPVFLRELKSLRADLLTKINELLTESEKEFII